MIHSPDTLLGTSIHLSDFEDDMVAGARLTDLSTSETSDLVEFHEQPSLGFKTNDPKKKKKIKSVG